MSLPVAHGLLGATVVAAFIPNVSIKRDWRVLLTGASLAILPDIDYVFYLGLGLGETWHRTFTHSIVFAIAVGLLTAAFVRTERMRMGLVYSLVTLSHALLDILTSRDIGGVELFWPFDNERIRYGFINYHVLISEVPRPLSQIFWQFLTTSMIELAVFGPILLAMIWIKHRGSNV